MKCLRPDIYIHTCTLWETRCNICFIWKSDYAQAVKLITDQQKTSEQKHVICLTVFRWPLLHPSPPTYTHTMNTIHAARVRMANFHAFTSGVASFLLILTGQETRSVPQTFWTKTMCELIPTL